MAMPMVVLDKKQLRLIPELSTTPTELYSYGLIQARLKSRDNFSCATVTGINLNDLALIARHQ